MALQVENGSCTPIAIVGMACRLPGEISTLDEFWTMLSRSRDGWREVPEERFSSEAFYHPSPQKTGSFNLKGGYFLRRDLSKFDAPFFNITEQEAVAMDPQQRNLLEVTYEALENAGIPKESISGRNMGVYIAGRVSDYRMGSLQDAGQVPIFDATGNHPSVQAGRVSYFFNLRGPCFTVDTACSSGLYALHSAVQSIRSGESDSAIVAGACLRMQPDDMITMSMLGIYNENGRTFAFDHRAKSGYAPGEGVGAVILKPLDQALRDNDKIRSIIVNTGTNQDGKTVGLTTPNGESQEQLMRDVYARANIDPEEVGFVEAHGTGTKVGDPTEAKALQDVFGGGRTRQQPLYIGSVKSNVGHLENVSGIIAIIKASLMLEKGFILPNANFEKANPAIPMDEWNMKVSRSVRPWPKNKKYLSVNNFSFGGSNAHAVLERPPPPKVMSIPPSSNKPVHKLFPLSGKSEESVKKQGSQLSYYIEQHPEVFQRRKIHDIAYTLGERRSHLSCRLALTATSLEELSGAINSAAAIPSYVSKTPKLAFTYTGQGAQWATMGVELLDSHPVFANTLKAADEILTRVGAEFSLIEELKKAKEESSVGEPHVSQAACTAVQLGLTELLKSWDITPSYVVGHSSGEIGAAYATGAITLEDAMAIAFFRGSLVTNLKTKRPDYRGSMLAVGKGPAEIKAMIVNLGLEGIVVACENSPESVTVSGIESSIDLLAVELERQSIFNRKLRVDVGYHSPQMQFVAEDYLEALKNIRAEDKSGVQMYSSLQGKKLDSTTSLDASYWVENLTNPVLFSSALYCLCTEAKPDIVVEIGPHSALEGPIKQIIKAAGQQATIKYLPTLIRNKDACQTTVKLAGSLFVNGLSVNFNEINQSSNSIPKPALIHDFKPYPWSDLSFWAESRASKQRRLRPFRNHDLLGLLEAYYSELEPTWRNTINVETVPWLKDHCMQSLTTFPLAGYLCMAVEAAHQRAQLRGIKADQIDGYRLREVHASKAFIMEDGTDYETLVTLRPYAEGTRSYSDEWDEFHIYSWSATRGWLEHCRCLVSVKKADTGNSIVSTHHEAAGALYRHAQTIDRQISHTDFYEELGSRGAGYGPLFQLQAGDQLKASGEYATTTARLLNTAAVMPHKHESPSILPASFMDLFFQLTFPILGAGKGEMPSLFMPSGIKEVDISASLPNQVGEEVLVVAHGQPEFASAAPVDFDIGVWHFSKPGQPVAMLNGFRMTPVMNDLDEQLEPRSLCYKVQWEPLHGATEVADSATESLVELKKAPRSRADSGIAIDTEASSLGGESDKAQRDEVVAHVTETGNKLEKQNGISESFVKVIPNNVDEFKQMNGIHKAPVVEEIKIDGASNIAEPVVIVSENKENDPLVRELISLLRIETGATPIVRRLFQAEVEAKPYIVLSELDGPLLKGMSKDVFERVQKLLLTASSLLWVTSGAYKIADQPENNIAQGILRTVRSESEKVAATLDLDPNSQISTARGAELIFTALNTALEKPENDEPVDFEFAEENGNIVVPRVVEEEDINMKLFRETQDAPAYPQTFEQEGRRLKVAVGTAGLLDSLYWKDDPDMPLPELDIEIKVATTSMNFKDVVVAMGQVSQPYIGIECAGVVSRVGSKVTTLQPGDRVCAMPLGAYSTYARCPATSAAIIPEGMSFETAATIPVVYSTAYYGLFTLANLQAGEKILIHAAAGGVGQAAIQLAQMVGAEIFATVGSTEKKKLLTDVYNIPENRIFYSRNTSFGPAIRDATKGEGVDVVINSLAGDLLRETWQCLAPFGRFIEIGKRDIGSNTRLEMSKFEYNCSFSSVDLTKVAAQRPKIMSRVLNSVVALLTADTVKPVTPIESVSIAEVETALRRLQSGKTSGKVVVSHKSTDMIKATHSTQKRDILSGDATYIIIGGTGGLGRSMTKRMVQRGARSIVLLSRSATINREISTLMEQSRAQGASVRVMACDVGDEASVDQLVSQIQQNLPPIRGVIHAAMVLRDTLFEKMTFEDYDLVTRSKVAGGWNMHKALLNQPLDFFIVLSSVAGIIGNRGQAAYAGANTFLDALVQHRLRNGLKATALNLAAVEGVGYLAANSDKASTVLKNIAGSSIHEPEVLALIEAAITGDVGNACGEQCVTGLHFSDGANLPYYASDAKFQHLRAAALAKLQDAEGAGGAGSGAVLSIAQELKRAATAEEAHAIAMVGVRDKLSAILMLPAAVMEAQQATTTVAAFGLDSLNAIELRNWISKELHVHLQVLELLTCGTLSDLASLILKKTSLEGAWSA